MKLEDPWLVAVWPGMGGVAQIAGNYLVQQLGAEPVSEIHPGDYFDVRSITVREGLIQEIAPPKNVLLGWKNSNGPDLLIFIGDRQPQRDGFEFCQRLLGEAARFGVREVFTFAAMATPIHPESAPRVFAAATTLELIERLRKDKVHFLKEAEVSGLNGVLVAAAAAENMSGACLLGEFPYFAGNLPNPKASGAVLRVFSSLAGLELDYAELEAEAERVERGLVQNLEQMQGLAETLIRPEEEEDDEPEEKPDELEAPILARIEALFAQAQGDRSKAMELKAELDRHSAFKRYEDRFLDLFKHGE